MVEVQVYIGGPLGPPKWIELSIHFITVQVLTEILRGPALKGRCHEWI